MPMTLFFWFGVVNLLSILRSRLSYDTTKAMNDGEQLWQDDRGLWLVFGETAHFLGEDACDWLTSLRAHKKVALGTISQGVPSFTVIYKRGARKVQ